jgi:hypothetical protein
MKWLKYRCPSCKTLIYALDEKRLNEAIFGGLNATINRGTM